MRDLIISQTIKHSERLIMVPELCLYGLRMAELETYLGYRPTRPQTLLISKLTVIKIYKDLWDQLKLDNINNPELANIIMLHALEFGTKKTINQLEVCSGMDSLLKSLKWANTHPQVALKGITERLISNLDPESGIGIMRLRQLRAFKKT